MAQERIVINAEKRSVTGKKVNALRRAGKLPGVIYGRHMDEALPIQMEAHATTLILNKLTSSTLITLDVDGDKHNVIVRDRQRDVIFGKYLHIDFLAVSMREKLRTTVGIELVGEAPILKTMEVVINQGLNSLEIESLPADLPEKVEVDISSIESLDDIISVSDLKLGDKVTILTPEDEVIVSVTTVAAEPEPEELEEAAEGEPEVVEKGKKEDEEDEE